MTGASRVLRGDAQVGRAGQHGELALSPGRVAASEVQPVLGFIRLAVHARQRDRCAALTFLVRAVRLAVAANLKVALERWG
jgi:hypothetical protein